jgi:hypothetical protein
LGKLLSASTALSVNGGKNSALFIALFSEIRQWMKNNVNRKAPYITINS